MERNRKPTPQEEKLIELLIDRANLRLPQDWKDALMVVPMDDGDMGGLYLIPKGLENINRTFGSQVSEVMFQDSDGVDVIATLYVDDHNRLFELDIWKTNFMPLIDFPKSMPA